MNLTASPYQELQPYLPQSWSRTTSSNNLHAVPRRSEEYDQVMSEFSFDTNILYRHQNINQYGMFLIRQQQLQVLHPTVNFSKVKRYVVINGSALTDALKYNLDERRLGQSFTFSVKPPSSLSSNQHVLIISFVTNEAHFGTSNLYRERDCDMYIEYVV